MERTQNLARKRLVRAAVEKKARISELKRMMQWLKLAGTFAVLFACAACGSQPQGLEPEIPRNEMPSRDAGNPPRVADGARYDLARDEQRGGHTLEKHVGRTDDELRERLERERNISAASTWTNREVAEETVSDALRQERYKIEKWEARGYPRANLALHFDAGREIGRSMRHGEATSSPCTEAVIVLKADGADSFYVLTTYPEESR